MTYELPMDLQCFYDYSDGRDYRGVALCQTLDTVSKRLAQPDGSHLRFGLLIATFLELALISK